MITISRNISQDLPQHVIRNLCNMMSGFNLEDCEHLTGTRARVDGM